MNSRQTDSQRRRDKGALRFFALRVAQRARLQEREGFVDQVACQAMLRSIFYYNTCPQLDATVGLHFFEPRYRILVQRAMNDPQRARSFVFLPNYSDYQAAHGDLGYLATIVAFQPHAPNPNELPRADV